jgi:uncharacterized protein
MLLNFTQFEGFNSGIHTNTNCLLKCSYCYEINKDINVNDDKAFWETTEYKNNKHDYSFISSKDKNCVIPYETCVKFIDKLLEFPNSKFFNEYIKNKDSLVFDFTGGDALQYPDLLDKIVSYLVKQLTLKNSIWKYSWKISISSNGVSLLNPKARKFCEKWKDSMSLGISIDGCPELHDLNRYCFADNEDGSKNGSWKYIMEIWNWYRKHFPDCADSTKWTIAPNSYKYLFDSVKYLYENLGIKLLMFNRVMEDHIQDTPEQLWELIQQFEKIVDYTIEHHTDLYVLPLDYNRFASTNCTQTESIKQNGKDWSRCGFGKMPMLTLDGSIYPCFRMIPKHNMLGDSRKYAQGHVDTSILENEEMLKKLNHNSCAANMLLKDKCKDCKIYSTCEHCAADCVSNDGTLTKTTSICNFHRLEVYYSQLYWERIKSLHPNLYKKYDITWTQESREELMKLVLQDIINLKGV